MTSIPPSSPPSGTSGEPADLVPRTRWCLIRAAASASSPGGREALEAFCLEYERPIRIFIAGWLSRHGQPGHLAEDLTQAFFARLIGRNELRRGWEKGNPLPDGEGNPRSGISLRSFLFTALRGFLIDEHRKDTARGKGRVHVRTDLEDAEWWRAQPVEWSTPYDEAQRQWLRTLLALSLEDLRRHYAREEAEELFAALRPIISKDQDEGYAEISARTGQPINTLKGQTRRMRGYWQRYIRKRVAETLDDDRDEAVEAELAELMGYR